MTQGADAAEPARDTSTTWQRTGLRWRRVRWPLLVAGVVALVALLGALLVPRTSQGDLDPNSATPDGSRAVTQILGRQGVQLSLVTHSGDLAAQSDAGTTLVVVHPELLGPDQLDRVAGAGGDVVLVEPDSLALQRLARFAAVAGTVAPRDGADPACPDPDAAAAGTARAGGHLYRPGAARTADTVACYPQPGESGVAGLVRSRTDGRTITVLGQADVLRNGHLAEQGNAALALRLLGAHDRLVWYLPDPLELSAGAQPPSVSDLTPPWVRWVTLQLLIALVVAMLWRARRLGKLVGEPLPIVVRAAEAQEGRARLYRQAGARDLAAATLRTATARRLATRLDVPPDAGAPTLAALVAQVVNRPVEQVQALLLGPAPSDDAALVRLADQLDLLERDVSDPGAVAVTPPSRSEQPHREAPHR